MPRELVNDGTMQPAINVFDVGGRYGLHRSWQNFEMPINYYCFEADAEEAIRLNEMSARQNVDGQAFYVINAAVSDSCGQADVYLYEQRDLSSLYRINPGVSYRYGNARLERTVTVATTTLDAVVGKLQIRPDFLSIDAQGASISILKGGNAALRSTMALRCEMEFFPLYKDAPLAYDVMAHLDSRQYSLARIETCGPGQYGISTEMNSFSVSPWDARPSSCDAVFINKDAVEQLLAESHSKDAAARLVYLAAFCIHNGCGYYAAEIFDSLSRSGRLAGVLESQPPLLRRQIKNLFDYYLSLPRSNINVGFDGLGRYESWFREPQKAALGPATRAKLDRIYSQPFQP